MRMAKSRYPLSQEAFQEKVHRIRSTFKKHKPQIIIEKHVGSGGFADVFLARSDYDGVKDFAIKILRNELLEIRKGNGFKEEDEEMRAKDVTKRFSNESYVQWALSKSLSDSVADSVVKVYDHGVFDSENCFRFILMEQMGATLRDYIHQYKDEYNSQALLMQKFKIIKNIADIINNVHHEGIFHRDIKPENILFTREAIEFKMSDEKTNVKLADFGTVRWVKSYNDKYDGIIIGSQFYLSPEQIFSPGKLDLRTDIYSFGVVCYELLYGVHPKNISEETTDIILKLARAKPMPQTPPINFEGLYDIIFKCMNDIRSRYQSMEEVVRELGEVAESLN